MISLATLKTWFEDFVARYWIGDEPHNHMMIEILNELLEEEGFEEGEEFHLCIDCKNCHTTTIMDTHLQLECPDCDTPYQLSDLVHARVYKTGQEASATEWIYKDER